MIEFISTKTILPTRESFTMTLFALIVLMLTFNATGTPLVYAILDNDLTLVEKLISEKAEINEVFYDKGSFQGDSKVASMLAKPETQKNYKYIVNLMSWGSFFTPLVWAIFRRNIHIVKFLVKNGADLYHVNVNGDSILFLAASLGDFDIVNFLVEQKVDVNQLNNHGFSAFSEASSNRRFDIVEFLIKNSAKVSDENGNSLPLIRACFAGHFEIVKFLITNNANVNSRDRDGSTPLIKAIINSNFSDLKFTTEDNDYLQIVEYLLSLRANVNI
jgi:ankyrin repeat protein